VQRWVVADTVSKPYRRAGVIGAGDSIRLQYGAVANHIIGRRRRCEEPVWPSETTAVADRSRRRIQSTHDVEQN